MPWHTGRTEVTSILDGGKTRSPATLPSSWRKAQASLRQEDGSVPTDTLDIAVGRFGGKFSQNFFHIIR